MDRLLELIKPVLATLAAAVASVGFVAFVGAAVLWARFWVAEIPPDQAVSVVPRSELVAVGASVLVTFVALGLVGVLLVYLISTTGEPTRRVAWALAALVVAELVVVVLLAEFRSLDALLLITGLLVGGAALGVAARLVLKPDPPPLIGQTPPQPKGDSNGFTFWRIVALVVVVGLIALLWSTERWLASLTLIVLALGALNLAVAKASGKRFWPFGIAVFASVAVFGAAYALIDAHETPMVQAAAFVTTGERRGACALYVTETDKRLYLARVDLLPGPTDTKPRRGSGRLFSLPKEQLLAWAIGPLQTIGRAQTQAVALRDEMLSQNPPALATATPSAPVAVDATAPAAAEAAAVNPESRPSPTPVIATAAVATPTPSPPPAGDRVADLCSPRGVRAQERQSAERVLARKYMPILSVAKDDGFWPVPVGTLFKLRGGQGGNRRTCLRAPGNEACDRVSPADVPWTGAINEWLEYPANDFDPKEQASSVRAALEHGNPYSSALQYFLVARGGGPSALTSLQYWYFFPFNYQDIVGVPTAKAGYHEGDFESTGVLLSKTGRPVYVWLARHGSEGERYAFDEPALEKAGDHVRVFSARGSHATYATCGLQHRPHLKGKIDDRVPCPEHNPLVFEPQATPLSDLSLAPWACFRGRFGHSIVDNQLLSAAKGAIIADGPRSPLWQQEFGRVSAHPCEDTPEPPDRDLGREESNDDVTSLRLRDRAGSLGSLFNSCAFWQQRPAQGAYVSVCDAGALDRFFRSGLENSGPGQLRIRTADSSREAKTVPAILRTPQPAGIDGARILSDAAATPDIYVARYASPTSNQLLTAFFSAVPVERDSSLRLDVSDAKRWRLIARGRVVAEQPPRPFTPSGDPGGEQDINPGAEPLPE